MAKRGHSEEEILRVLREAESGTTVVEVCRKHGISQQSFYLWKKKYSGLGLSELRELRQLREENGKLKRWLPTSAWTGTSCRRSSQKSCKASCAAGAGGVGRRGPSTEPAPRGGADPGQSGDSCVTSIIAIPRMRCGCDCANWPAVGCATAIVGSRCC